MKLLSKIFGDVNQKYIKKLQPIIEKINSLEPEFEKLSDQQLKEKTDNFKNRLKKNETLDQILPEAFALVREASKRTLGQRHFDVQLIGGIVLHQGKIAEMKTGEGKTLAATLPLYLNALEGKGVHLVTVNDYLAKRDTVWMGQIYHFLGLSVGCLNHEASYIYDPTYVLEKQNQKNEILKSQLPISNKILNNKLVSKEFSSNGLDKVRDIIGGFKVVEDFLRPVSRKEAYAADITYGTNNEFGFDYLRDNMVYPVRNETSNGFYYDIPVVQRENNFAIIDEIDSILIDEARTPLIISAPEEEATDKYYQFAQLIADLKEKEDFELDEKERNVFFTESGQNKIVKTLNFDPWRENDIATTHQLEAALKARVLFKKDQHYIVKDGQIVIVDEFTGRLMPGRRWSAGIHQAIEAKEGVKVKQESKTFASITFQNYFRMYKKLAGMTGTAITSAEEFDKVYKLEVIQIPTNKPMIRKDMPDRIYKTFDGKIKALIKEIKERHQKGQPILVGTISIDKNEFLGELLKREGIPCQILNAKQHEKEGEIIAQAGKLGAVTIATNMAGRGVDIILGGNPPDLSEQKKVIEAGGLHVIGTERHEARRIDNQLRGRAGRQGDPGSSQFFVSLEDDLMRIFGGERIKNLMQTLKFPEDQPLEAGLISKAIESAQSRIEGLNFDLRKHILEYDDVMNKHREVFYKKRREILEKIKNNKLKPDILEIIKKAGFKEEDYQKKEKELGSENMREMEKYIYLKVLDNLWTEHLENMEYLRDSVSLRAYGQQDPLVEYKKESRQMFSQLLANIETMVANIIFQTNLKPAQEKSSFSVSNSQPSVFRKKVGRNDPCPCGSGKKYKRCCGA